MKNLIRIFYVSNAIPGLGKQEVADILRASAANNKTKGFTGVLCYKSGHFAQVIEGEELELMALYLKIAQDKRHTHPVIISISTVDQQIFKTWAMGGISEDLAPLMEMDDIQRFRNTAPENRDAVLMMRRWLALLESQPRAPRKQ